MCYAVHSLVSTCLAEPNCKKCRSRCNIKTVQGASTVESPAEMAIAHVSRARGSESAMRFMVAYNVL